MTTILPLAPDLSLTLTDQGAGRPALVLHGGGGSVTVAGLAAHLAQTRRVLTPTHPGWNGTPRPERLAAPADYARTYLALLDAQGLTDVLVVGSSLGGWIGVEMALQDTAGRVGSLVLIDAVGIEVPGAPIRNISGMTPAEIATYSFHDPSLFRADPAGTTDERQAAQRASMATLAAIAGEPYMHDPALRARLPGIAVPTLVLWGASDGVVTRPYGQAYADAIPGAAFTVLPAAGHLPQLEQPAATFAAVDAFARAF
ncbi:MULTISPECIES: alpha/beta fold hydrolase [Deinococcus]|uniref:Alpha/beta fold hydrolase n=1 Tax=Deinococcus rufus TaxID=2136097 RepID=A0ABV7ZHG9_9DEIO|nr:alpha/beta hydrolase [Deinococcus sp. AB2017081]WQE96719.1 alpha/beta hydrolase [Deinococcus sp. AB2017081]